MSIRNLEVTSAANAKGLINPLLKNYFDFLLEIFISAVRKTPRVYMKDEFLIERFSKSIAATG